VAREPQMALVKRLLVSYYTLPISIKEDQRPNPVLISSIVLIGRPGSPAIRSLSLDLERRGFIVYVVVRTDEDTALVQSDARYDIKPFALKSNDVS
jgi:hypothetical protein